jgi:hypothetical protein
VAPCLFTCSINSVRKLLFLFGFDSPVVKIWARAARYGVPGARHSHAGRSPSSVGNQERHPGVTSDVLRHLIPAAFLVLLACKQEQSVKPAAVLPVQSATAAFAFDSQGSYAPRIPQSAVLPKRVSIAEIVSHPRRHRGHRVTLVGCYITIPNDGTSLMDPKRAGASIAMFGGSDDRGSQPFDWTRQQICGTFVGVIEWKPSEVPLTYLCPDLCFVSEGTVESRIVSNAEAESRRSRE